MANKTKSARGIHVPLRHFINLNWLKTWRPLTRIGLGITVFMLFLAVAGPLLMTHDPYEYSFNMNELPDSEHWLGTDDQGQDIYSRLILGARLSLVIGTLSALLALSLGCLLALAALAVGPLGEMTVFALVDLIRAMPGILFALALIVALEPGTGPVIIALGISFCPYFARITRATYLQEMAKPYTQAARVFGASKIRIAFRHVFPNILGAIITQFAIVLPRCIVSESVLSFLGLGVSPETPTWGRMIANAANFVEEAPHVIIIPVIALVILTFGLAMLGDEFRRSFDPSRRRLTS